MGKISQTLTGRFRKHRKFAQQLHQQAKQDAVQVSKDVRSVQQLVEHEGYDPLHAAYISAQNLASFFVESVSAFDEFNAYWDIVEPAQDEYMPSGPPISPLTVSYFTTWAMFDVRFGPNQETCEFDGDIVLNLVGDHAQPEAVLEFRETPRFARNDLRMAQLQDKQVGQQRNPEGFFMPTRVPPHLMLVQPQVRFEIPIDELYAPAILV